MIKFREVLRVKLFVIVQVCTIPLWARRFLKPRVVRKVTIEVERSKNVYVSLICEHLLLIKCLVCNNKTEEKYFT